MAHGVSEVLCDKSSVKMVTAKQQQNHHSQQNVRKTVGVMGSRRIFAPAFKLKVLDSYRNDIDCRGNQRATARKYGIHRRQIQKWLQCEDNLRTSCAEIAPGTSAIVNSSELVNSRILKSEETAGPGVSPASPALNLSLARLHGDELPVQQGPPPSHPPSRNSPSTPEFGFQAALPLQNVSYVDYSNQDQHLELHEKILIQDVQKYGDCVDSKYYLSNPESLELDGSQEVKLYQPLTPYHSPQDRFDDPSMKSNLQNYKDVDSPGEDRLTRAVLHALTEIKTERASPDSAATPGLYEIPTSPSASLVSFSHHTTISTNSPTPHFQPIQQSTVHTYTGQHSHPCQPDSEKPCCQENTDAKTEVRIEKEVDEKHQEVPENQDGVLIDYQRPPDASSLSASPERVESYSGPASPPGSSGRSSSSWSDSETDYTSSFQSTPGDLTRRRSFSLRFKLDVLDAFHRDVVVAGNQRATARKFGINRRQVQKWLGQESELRGEIALRGGNSRQRLGSNPDSALRDSPVDLRMTTETQPMLYCCEVDDSRQSYCQPMIESPVPYRTCTFSCCTENVAPCYQEMRRPCYNEANVYCYSPKESLTTLMTKQELQLKRPACSLSCCYQAPKRFCSEFEENCPLQEQPPQESPLCLVKPKKMCEGKIEPVTSTIPTPPAPVISSTPSKKDAILFKPYLDNPVSKPINDGYHGLLTQNANNNNCQGICNLNEGRGQDFALELSLRVPVSWRTQHSSYCDFPQIRSAFVRYPASPHYT